MCASNNVGAAVTTKYVKQLITLIIVRAKGSVCLLQLTFKKMSERPNLKLIPSGYDNTGKCKVEVSYPNFEKDLVREMKHLRSISNTVPLYLYLKMRCEPMCYVFVRFSCVVLL